MWKAFIKQEQQEQKKELLGHSIRHYTARQDWDGIIHEILDGVMNPWQHGLAIITNTDRNGKYSPHLSFYMKQGLKSWLRNCIWMMQPDQFEQIFTMASSEKVQQSDCFAVRNLGLPNNTLVFLIYQNDDPITVQRRAILAFAGPCLRIDLTHRLGEVCAILEKPTAPAKTHKPQILEEQQTPPARILVEQFRHVETDIIKTRLDYLESLEHPNPAQKRELKKLESYMIHLLRKSFDEPQSATAQSAMEATAS